MVGITQRHSRERNSLKDILPSEAARLNDNEIIAVSRICINKRIMQIRHFPNSVNLNVARILFNALRKARELERSRTGSIEYIKLTVGEAKRAFYPLEKMPSNSIKLVAEVDYCSEFEP